MIIYGKVQGVLFRYNVQDKANNLGLNGYVGNLEDGTVEVVVEGDEDNINELIEFCKSSPGSSVVEKVDVKEEKFMDEFSQFEIRF